MKETLTSIILAAGVGNRIRECTDQPKILLKLRGETLLNRHLRIQKSLGIEHVILVVGYEKQAIFDEVKRIFEKPKITFVEVDDFQKKGNSHSLLMGLESFKSLEKISGATIIFDADLFYDDAILNAFIFNAKANSVLIGHGEDDDIEATKTLIDSQKRVRKFVDKRSFTKAEMSTYEFAGEAIGVLRFDSQNTEILLKKLRDFLKNPQNATLNWEHPLNDFLKSNAMFAHFEASDQWMEIDDASDLSRAKSRFEK